MCLPAPVYSVSESESIFNINGSYYSKKGNNISRISKANIAELNENFVNLCNVLNSKYVRINENDNIESVKKGRGRPRKYPISTEVKPKGKRGRPRKLLPEEEQKELEDEKFINQEYDNETNDELILPIVEDEI